MQNDQRIVFRHHSTFGSPLCGAVGVNEEPSAAGYDSSRNVNTKHFLLLLRLCYVTVGWREKNILLEIQAFLNLLMVVNELIKMETLKINSKP